MTALHLAAKSGRVEAVKTLLQMKHVDINVKVQLTGFLVLSKVLLKAVLY